MKIRPTETGDTDEGEKEQTWVHLDWSYWCRLGERAGDRVDHPAPPHRHHFHVAFSSSVTSLISLLLLLQPQHPVALSRVQPHIMTMFYHLQRSHLQGQDPLQLLQLYEPCRQCVFPKQFNSLITHSHTHSPSPTHSQMCFLSNSCVYLHCVALKMLLSALPT